MLQCVAVSLESDSKMGMDVDDRAFRLGQIRVRNNEFG